jgi:hypothetical protein
MKKTVLVFLLLSMLAVAQSAHKSTVAWLPSPDAAANPTLAYNVYRMTAPCPADGSFPASGVTVTKVASAISANSFVDTGVSVSNTYCYAITATLNGVESAAVTGAGTIPLAKPQPPVTVTTQ